ncbi:hypothetical protein [Nocardioides sp. Leaf285]|uniref:hypothetical protein n=1 Tax=Nocardioides sp. Leaf285 TaxID=1736322 RepID=UPI000702FABD|nr:hypothetical protein [Nocardioides sp. Leaf285]KQP63106.1 hypothetical protein ASF47_19025 [Nocardioides sp. Leaf285]
MTLRPFPDLSGAAARLWRYGDDTGGIRGRRESAGDPPVPGDLWIASATDGDFGRNDLALVLLTAVDHERRQATCMLVTDARDPHFEGSLIQSGSVLGVPLVLWPHLQVDIDYSILDRRLGDGIEAVLLRRVLAWAQDVTDGYLAAASTSSTARFKAPRPPLPTGPVPLPGSTEAEVAHSTLTSLTEITSALARAQGADHARDLSTASAR